MPLFLIPILASFKSAVGAALTFISKPPGSWIAAALGLVLGLWWFGQHEFNSGKAACETAHAEAAANERARVISAISAVNDRSILRTNESEKADTKNRVILRVIHDQAAAMPGASNICIDADTADRVREIN